MTDGGALQEASAPAEQAHRPSAFYLFAGIVSWPVVYGLYRFKQRGYQDVPRAGGFVLASNHASNFDPWPLGAAFFPGRYLRFMTKSELFWWPLKVLLDWGGAFPVRRGEADVQAIQTAVELCRQGHVVVMFPEGTRRRKGLRKRAHPRARPGAALIALRAGVPLVPAAVLGTDRLARLAPLRVHYGAPIPLDDLQGVDLREAAQIATERLMTEIARLESLE
ncbi:MAG TPA: lysophospholipid acyltransferase family protein [Gaiellaceae bacterium]|nr:lysophospholipid acyltransferase family protein [Gaiellaceae bacterium]